MISFGTLIFFLRVQTLSIGRLYSTNPMHNMYSRAPIM